MEPTTGYLVWRLSMKWRAAADRVLAPLGLTHAQFSVLGALSGVARAGGRPSQRELADFTGLEPICVSKLARALEKAGLVERPVDPADPRAVRLGLTERGREVVAVAITAVHEVHAELTKAIGGPDGERNRELRDILLTLLGETPVVHHTTESEQTMTAPRVFNGQNINVAAAATRAILDALVERSGTTFEQFVTLRTLAGGAAGRDTVARMAAGPAADEDAIKRALRELETAGLVQASGDLFEQTPQGKELFERVTAASVRAGDQLFDGIPEQDLSTTKRVLDLITERAQVVRAEL